MGCAITRIVKFLRRGEKGNSLITAVTNLRKYTLAQWQSYGAVNKQNNWINISNAADMKVGDTIVINGVVTDKENISISLYAMIVAIAGTTVIANSTTIIMAGERGIPGVGTNGKTTYLHIKYSNDGGKTFTANSGETPGAYIGVCTDFTENDPTSVSSYTWSKIKGEQGDRGPALRGPQDFSSLPTDYQFYQGADSDPYVDIVYYNGSYYKCVWTHKKGSKDISSSGSLTAKYWVLSDKVEMIATKILLASYALIKNLGVEAIEMKDGSDNIVFRAKNGEVICKSGTFENVTVTGNITAQTLRLHISSSISNIDGAVVQAGWSSIVLPELADGECMNLKIHAPYGTRSSPDAGVKPQNGKVQIWVHGSNEIAQSKEIGLGYGLFDAVGIGKGSYTIWAIR